MSGVCRVAEETRLVFDVVEAAIAEAKSVHGKVESRVALLAAQTEASTTHIVGGLSECVQEVASEVQALDVADVVSQQPERRLEVVATSAAVTSERRTQMAVEEMRKEV